MHCDRVVCAVVGAILILSPAGLRAADPGTSTAFERVARWAHGPSFAVDAAVDLLLVGEGSSVRTYDPTDPLHPERLGEVELPGVVMEIERIGDLAFVAAARGGLQIVDVSDPTTPVLRGGLFTPGNAYAVTVEGSRAFVGDESGGLRIYDVANPDAPVELGAYDVDLYAMDVEVVGTIAYVADLYDGAFEIYDVTVPTAITPLAAESLSGPPWGVAIDGTRAVLVDDYAGITTFDVSDPSAPVETGHAWLDDVGYDVELRGTRAYVAEDWRGVTVYDLGALPSIGGLGLFDTPGSAFGVSVVGDVVFVADEDGGVWPVDMTVPTAPAPGSCLGPVGPLRQVFTDGDVSYVIDEAHGLRILQPLAGGGAQEIAAVELAGSPQHVDVEDGVAYVACSTAGVAVIDVADPRHPLFLRWIELDDHVLDSRAMDVSVDGSRLGVVDDTYGFYLFDVTDPTSPVERGRYYIGGTPRNVIVEDTFAYVADHNALIRVLQLEPTVDQIGQLSKVGYNYDLAKHGSILFVAKDWRGVWMLDVSNPTEPTNVYGLTTIGSAIDLSVVWPYLYVAEGSAVRSYDVGFPMAPVQVGEYVVDDVTRGVCATRQLVHVAGMFGGWYELESTLQAVDAGETPSARAGLAVDAPHPNPFNPRATLRFALAKSGTVHVSVVDARGRTVAVLLDAVLSRGPHDVTWNGRDRHDVAVASGVYRFRVEAGGEVRTRGAVLVR